MTNKATKRALLTSIMAFIICAVMLIGTTFAWFTDSVVSGKNQIVAGNLDVELYYDNDETAGWTKVASNTSVFKKNTLWEPGHTEIVKLKVANEGSLALKYQFMLDVASETEGTNVAGDKFKLSDYIMFGITTEDVTTREAAIAAVKDNSVRLNEGITDAGNLKKGEKSVVTMVVYMPTTVDNVANHMTGTPAPTIDFGLKLLATQYTYESDSFNNQYDKDATFITAWDGTVGTLPAEVDGVITITTGNELAALAAAVNAGNTFKDKTIVLGSDINLDDQAWTPIGQNGDKAGFQGVFDGKNNTIYNLNVNNATRAYQSAGLFGSARYATIKNFTVDGATIYNLDDAGNTSNGAAVVVGAAQFATTINCVDVKNATVTSNRRASAIAGYYVGTITNCDVDNVKLTAIFDEVSGGYDNADKVGGIIAYSNGASTITNNTVKNSVIIGYRDVGGIAGYATTSTLTNNKVENTAIYYNNEHDYKGYNNNLEAYDVNAIIGEGNADTTNVATNVTVGSASAITVSTDAELAAALNKDTELIDITLANDVALNVSDAYIKLGGANTKNIVINGNGKTWTWSTNYWSRISTTNPDATITINNATVTSTQPSGTWNSYDVTFHNCNVVVNDVDFEKAVAVDVPGKTAEFNNVTINETHDYYALWVVAGSNVTVNNSTITSAGRGIKIDNEYVNSPAKTTLAVNNTKVVSNKKAAILVDTPAGADITVNNIDITGVAKDTVNAVWIDSDATAYASLVNVTGATVINEP